MKTRSKAKGSETETSKRSSKPKAAPPEIKRPPRKEVVEEIEIVDSDSDGVDDDASDHIEPAASSSSSIDFTETDPTLISTLVKEHCMFCLTRKTRTLFSISSKTREVIDGYELLSCYFGSGTADSLNDIFDAAIFTNKRLLTSEFPAPLLCENCVETLCELDTFHKKLESLQRQILLRIRKLRQQILSNRSSTKYDEDLSESRLQFESELLENCHGNEDMAEMVLSILDRFQDVFKEETSDKIEIHLEHLEKVVSLPSDEDDDDVPGCHCHLSPAVTVSTSSQTDNNDSGRVDQYLVKVVQVSEDDDEAEVPLATDPTSLAQCDDADNADSVVNNDLVEDCKPTISTITISTSTQTDNFERHNDEDDHDDNPASPVYFDDAHSDGGVDNDFNIEDEPPGSPKETVEESIEHTDEATNLVPEPTAETSSSPRNVSTSPLPIQPVMQQNVVNPSQSTEGPSFIIRPTTPQNVANPSQNTESPPFIIVPTTPQKVTSPIEAVFSIDSKVPETSVILQHTGIGICIVRKERPTSSSVLTVKEEQNGATDKSDDNKLGSEKNQDQEQGESTEKSPERARKESKKRKKAAQDESDDEDSSAESESSQYDSDDNNSEEEDDGRKKKKTQKSRTKRQARNQNKGEAPSKPPFKCSLCKQRFLRRYDAYRHIRNIHQTEPLLDRQAVELACTQCDFKCEKAALLKKHMMDLHQLQMPRLNNRTYECDLCGYSKDGLKLNAFLDHLRKHESFRKSVSCEDCLQKFTTKQMYQMHPCPQTGRLAGTGAVLIGNFDNIRKGNEYKCRFCGDLVKFHSEKSLQTHFLSMHTENNPFLCEICGGDVDFKSKNCLKTHMIEAHDAVKFKCRICEVGKLEGFKSYEELHLHMGVEHFGGFYTCPDCPKKLTDLKSLEEHAATHANTADNENPDKIYMCEFCALPFKSKKGLRSHKEREHSGEQTDSAEPEMDANGPAIPKRPRLSPSRPGTYVPRKNGQAKPFVCSLCDYDCCTFYLHRRHMQIDHGILLEKKINTRNYECATCNYSSNEVRLKGFVMHLQEHEDSTKKFCCEDCFQFFSTKQMYQYHSCPQTGKLPGTATTHVEGFDMKEKEQYPCRTCGTIFRGELALKKHCVKEQHGKPFLCELCEAGEGDKETAFTTKDALKTHRIFAHGAVPYKCRLCVPPQNFNRFHDIFTHTNTVHFECFYECPHCPKKFAERLKLENHMSSHSDARTHICSFCGSGLKSISTLRRHIKLYHTEEGKKNQHICQYCSKGFTEKSNMVKHIRTHEREKGQDSPLRKRSSPRQKRVKKY